MQIKIFFAVLVILSFLSTGTLAASESMNAVDTNAKAGTPPDHKKLAEYYENQVKEMNAKAEEQQKILDEYEVHSYYYGPEGQLYQSHHRALLEKYTKAAERNREMAEAHRKMENEAK